MSRSLWWLLAVTVAVVLIPMIVGCMESPSVSCAQPECIGPGCPIPGPDGKIVAPNPSFLMIGSDAPTSQPDTPGDAG